MLHTMTTRPALIDSVWYPVDRPVLLGIAQSLRTSPGEWVHAPQVATSVALPLDEVVAAGQRLAGEYIVIKDLTTFGGPDWAATALTSAGLREVGLWPTPETALDRFVAALEAAEAQAAPEDKPKLRAVIRAVGGMGRDLGVNVFSALLTGQ
jgi:hypothetical protein